LTEKGNILGHRDGVHHYTIGQRKAGICCGSANVVGSDTGRNWVIVGDRDITKKRECTIQQVNRRFAPALTAPIQAEV